MARKLDAGIMKPFDQLSADKVVDAVPVVTAMRMLPKIPKKLATNSESLRCSPATLPIRPRNLNVTY